MILELLVEMFAVKQAPHWMTAAGVAWLVVAERRRARRLTQLERKVSVLAEGHAGDAVAHRQIPAALREAEAHARH